MEEGSNKAIINSLLHILAVLRINLLNSFFIFYDYNKNVYNFDPKHSIVIRIIFSINQLLS